MTSTADTIRILSEALTLEREATDRYAAHQRATSDPRLFVFWEGLRRNEAEHHADLEAALARLGAGRASAGGPDD